MSAVKRNRVGRGLVLIAAVALLAVGCASSDGDREGAGGVDGVHEGMLVDDAGGSPVDGGTLTFGAFVEPKSLDPAETIAALTTGGLEMVNIYDSLLRFDAEEQRFEPQMAQAIEHSDDYRVWTLRLRDGVRFTDGSPVDSYAVKASQARYVDHQGPEAALWEDTVDDVGTPDPATVVYTLNKPWSEFPGMLTSGPGMIVAASSDGPDGQFNPVGAGPFLFDSWKQGESMEMTANKDYWDGDPPLDGLRFVYLPGEDVAVETMRAGGIDATFVRDPDEVASVLADEPGGYVSMTAAQNAAIINAAPGRPGSDPRVRQAMQLAIDPQLMTQRAYGTDDGSSTLFPGYSRWHTDTAGLPYDPERARELLDAAKADGYDGKVEYAEASDPGSQKAALAFESMLEDVGFDVTVNLMPTATDQVRKVIVDRDYDVSGWGLSFRESDPYPKMFATMDSEGTQTYGMHTSPAMDALIEQFQATTDHEAKVAVMDRIQQQVNEEVPFLVFGAFAETIVWPHDVHGVVGTSNSMVLFGNAWKD